MTMVGEGDKHSGVSPGKGDRSFSEGSWGMRCLPGLAVLLLALISSAPSSPAASVREAPPAEENGEERVADLAPAAGRVLGQWGPADSPTPGMGVQQYAIGEAFLRAGDAISAEEHLRMVPQDDSLHVPALLLIALMQDRRGEREPALETYRRVTALGPGPYQARGLARSADLEFQLGRVYEALVSYRRLLQSSPPRDEEVWAVYQAGNCHLLLGESESAKERYETVAKLWPQSFWAPFAKERLEEMTWRARWTAGNIAR